MTFICKIDNKIEGNPYHDEWFKNNFQQRGMVKRIKEYFQYYEGEKHTKNQISNFHSIGLIDS